MVQALEDFEGTVCFNITGHTKDYLLKQDPDLIDSIKELVKKNVVGSYLQVIITRFSPFCRRKELKLNLHRT